MISAATVAYDADDNPHHWGFNVVVLGIHLVHEYVLTYLGNGL